MSALIPKYAISYALSVRVRVRVFVFAFTCLTLLLCSNDIRLLLYLL
jgi:hypothetical protein